MPPRPCINCGTPTNNTRCTPCEQTHQATRNQARPWYRDPAYLAAREQAAASLPLRCWLCHHLITHTGQDPDALTLDHKQPASTHHGTGPWYPAHRRCNSARGNKPPEH